MNKTNAVRILEAQKISHQIFEYKVNENDLSGTSVAYKIGVDEEHVFKTLVTRNDKTE